MLFALLPGHALGGNLAPEEGGLSAADLEEKKEHGITSQLLPMEEAEAVISPLATPPNTIANIFPDGGLARAVADLFGVPVSTRITQTDLNRVVGLEAGDRNIQNLAGMQFLHSLRDVTLHANRISDLGPLSGLRSLETLILNDNQVSNLQPLAGINSLNFLGLDDNHISNNLQPLAGLTGLEALWLDGNQISDLGPLAGLGNLVWLTFWRNQVQDLSPLAGMNRLVELWASDNRINDIGPLAGKTTLEALLLEDNQISDLRPLAGMTRMLALTLDNNRVSDLRPLAGMANVELLWLGRQNITLPTVRVSEPLMIENNVFQPNGARIAPSQISNNGTYTVPNIRWTNLPATVERVTYSFSQPVTVGHVTNIFFGTVTQPLSNTPFVDVQRGDWFHDAVAFVSSRNIMGGTTATTFEPHTQLNRAMLVTVLHRMAGSPVVAYRPVFQDVPTGQWFSRAVVWAFDNNIVTGVSETHFAPWDPITREQFATMMHRFAQFNGHNVVVSPAVNLNQFTDRGDISSWAWEAMRWSVHTGLITGTTDTTLAPQGSASRAQCAVIIMRYVQRFG